MYSLFTATLTVLIHPRERLAKKDLDEEGS